MHHTGICAIHTSDQLFVNDWSIALRHCVPCKQVWEGVLCGDLRCKCTYSCSSVWRCDGLISHGYAW